ncbi:MAG: cysteine desulfurase family protein [Parvicellaceae bacterium]
MKKIYLDNAATTPMAPEVLEAMLPFFKNDFGNPSSTHSFGRTTKNAIEITRKKIADLFHTDPSEIVFTSGGTEADNMALRCAVSDLGVKRIITSCIEHHAVGHTANHLKESCNIKVDLVKIDEKGHVDLAHLEELLSQDTPTLVSLMHANNEIGNLLDLKLVGQLCKKHHAFFHSDTVQTMGHYEFNLKEINIDFVTCAAHKFHGPKGVGFLYIKKNTKINQLITGGSQERNQRGGTENLYGIIGLGKALELAYEDVLGHQNHVQELKSYMIDKLQEIDPSISFNGDINPENSLYTVLNVCFPITPQSSMMLFSLDISGIAASGGSACSSGASKGSHVLAALPNAKDCQSVRFSFSRYTTKEEIDFALEKIKALTAISV